MTSGRHPSPTQATQKLGSLACGRSRSISSPLLAGSSAHTRVSVAASTSAPPRSRPSTSWPGRPGPDTALAAWLEKSGEWLDSEQHKVSLIWDYINANHVLKGGSGIF